MIDYMERSWSKLGVGSVVMSKARRLAWGGRFVVVGAKSSELKDSNGHLAVIPLRIQGGWPMVFGGAQNEAARSQGDKV
jgi:hypothetical protein